MLRRIANHRLDLVPFVPEKLKAIFFMPFWTTAPTLTASDVCVDVHSHLLPSVDDGLGGEHEAIAVITAMTEMGYKAAVCTPHIYTGMFNTDEKMLSNVFEIFAANMQKRFPEFTIRLGAEYMIDDNFLTKLHDPSFELLTFGSAQQRYLLVEFPTTTEPLYADDVIDCCAQRGITPIIAHVERYMFVRGDSTNARLNDWRRRGALTQINLGSVVGQFGAKSQNAARKLWKDDAVDLLGSDLHSSSRSLTPMAKAWKWLGKTDTQFDPSKQRAIYEAIS